MLKKKVIAVVSGIMIPVALLFGGTGRPEDGFLSFIVVLAFLGLILGILYLVDYIKILIHWFNEPLF